MWPQLFTKQRKLTPTQQAELVEKIHNEFNTASDKALAEANIILSNAKTDLITKAQRLKSVGFNSSPIVKIGEQEKATIQMNEHTASLINSYYKKYPFYKFISQEDVVKICLKYNLVYGPISHFIGDVPENNLQHIENFKVNQIDIPYAYKIDSINFSYGTNRDTIAKIQKFVDNLGIQYIKDLSGLSYNSDRRQHLQAMLPENLRRFVVDVTANIDISDTLSICAPIVDFNMEGLAKDDAALSKTLNVKYSTAPAPDPIVLQRVHGGFLIVTAWGAEAADPIIVNQINN